MTMTYLEAYLIVTEWPDQCTDDELRRAWDILAETDPDQRHAVTPSRRQTVPPERNPTC